MLNEDDLEELIDCFDIAPYQNFPESIESKLYIPESKSFYSLYRTPFFRHVLESVENPSIDILSLLVPSQVGKSQLIAGISIEWATRFPGELVLIYCPNNGNAADLMSRKIIPSVENSTQYQKCLIKCANGEVDRSSITKNSIKFSNGSEIQCVGVGGKTSRQSKTCSLVILDEYARMKTTTKDGDILAQAKTRTTSKSYSNRKVIVASTPLLADEDIHKLYKESRQITFEVPCPNCDTFQFLDFSNLKWEKQEDISDVIFSDMIADEKVEVYYECPHCNHHIKEKEKPELLNRGRIVIDGNEHLSGKQTCLHLNGLYSLEKWANIAAKFIRSQNDIQNLIEFKQQTLAEPWAVEAKSKTLKKETYTKGDFNKGIPPEDTYKIVAAIDVQENRYYYTTVAYTKSKKVCLIDWGEEYYNIENPFNPETLPYNLERKFYGKHEVHYVALDCGFNQDINIELCRSLSKTQGIRGFDQSKFSSVYMTKFKDPYLQWIPKNNTNELLDMLVIGKAFQIPSDTDVNDELLDHLTNVIKKGKFYVDIKDGARRDWRDCVRYCLALIKHFNFAKEVDQAVYVEANKEEIERKKAVNRANLNRMFST